VRFLSIRISRADDEVDDDIWLLALARTWVLLLGVSGLIVLFWFLSGDEALRYFVSFSIKKGFVVEAHLCVSVGAVRRRHVVSLCPLGRNRCGFFFKTE
jgi:hypothetical protein